MLEAAKQLSAGRSIHWRMILPNQALAQQAEEFRSLLPAMEIQTDGLGESLCQASLAIASTGTVTMECAFFGVPTVAIYKTSWSTYQIGKRIITVKFLAMPNLLANEEVFPEFIQGAATVQNITRAALDLLDNPEHRGIVKTKLSGIVASLGGSGASRRAARVILAVC